MTSDKTPIVIGATAVMAFAIGFGASALLIAPQNADEPIVRPSYALEPSRPVPTVPIVNHASSPVARCNPWEVSDIAMEHILDEMIRRGWRAPTQGAAVALTDLTYDPDIMALEPGQFVNNTRLSGRTSPEVAAAEEPLEVEPPVEAELPEVNVPAEPVKPEAPPPMPPPAQPNSFR